MDNKEKRGKKPITVRITSNASKKYDAYELKLFKKKSIDLSSKRTLSKEKKKKNHISLVEQPVDSGIDHLEYLKEKNSLARKRLLDLQKRLLELNSKEKSIYKAEDLKLPVIFDQLKDSETLNLIQKYSSVNLDTLNKSNI